MKEKFAISLFTQIISFIIQFLAYYILFLRLKVSLLGIWTFLTSTITLGFIFMTIGLDVIHLQYSGNEENSKHFGTYLYIKFLLLLLNIIMTILLITLMQLWNSIYLILILILLFSKIFEFVTLTFRINLKAKLKIFKADIPYLIITIGKSISIICLVLNLTSFLNPLLYIGISNLIFDILFLLFIVIISKRDFHIEKPKREILMKYLKDTKPLIIFSIVYVIANNLGNLIIEYSYGYESLGFYSFINSYMLPLLLLISGIFLELCLPIYSRFFEKKDISSIKKITYTLERYLSIVFLVIIVFVFVNGELLLSLFFPKFLNSIPILYLLIFVPYLVGISRPYAFHLIAGKKQKLTGIINSSIHILIIVLLILFIPENILFFKTLGLGIEGAALAQIIPWFLWCLINRYFSYKEFKILFQKRILLHIPIAIICYVISIFIKNFLSVLLNQNWIFLLIFSTSTIFLLFFYFIISF